MLQSKLIGGENEMKMNESNEYKIFYSPKQYEIITQLCSGLSAPGAF